MHGPFMIEDLANLRCTERVRHSLCTWYVEQALAQTWHRARPARGLAPLLRRVALRAAWRLTRVAGAESGPYTVQERATLVDAQGNIRTVCSGEIYVLLLPRTERDAA